MPDVIGIDHIYIAVTDLPVSEAFYDVVMGTLGFRKNTFVLNEDRHVQYFNRHMGYVLRPAHAKVARNAYATGLHHLCWRVENANDVAEAAMQLRSRGIEVSEAKHYPEYAEDYVACFLNDPDGIRLEITNYREERRARHVDW